MLSQHPLVSVVMPSYQASAHIRHALSALEAQATALPCEIIVVDSSTDGTDTIVRHEFPRVRLIHSDLRWQVGTARNNGIASAFGDIILFADADTEPCSTWIDQMSRAILDGGADAVCGSMRNGTPWSVSGSAGFYLEFFRFLAFDGEPRPAKYLVGGNCGFRRTLLSGAHFHDSSVGEDMLFSGYLAGEGRKLIFLPRASMKHSNRVGFATVFRYQYKLGKGAVLYRSAHSPALMRLLRTAPPLVFLLPFAVMIWIAFTIAQRGRWADLLRFAVALPACLIGNWIWSFGFYRALRQTRRDSGLPANVRVGPSRGSD